MTRSLAMSTIALLGTMSGPIGFVSDPMGSKSDPSRWTKTSPPATQRQLSGESLQTEIRMFWPNGDLRGDALRLEELARDLRAIAAGNLSIDDTTCVALANWRLTYRRALSLHGVSIGHPTLGTKPIHTSEVYFIDLDRGIARTLSRWYRLTATFTSSTSEH